MLLPQGVEKHKNLSTSFTRYDHLLEDLAENRFSGYIKLNFWEYEGVLVMDTGRMLEAYSSESDVYLTGEQGIARILAKAQEQDGNVEVYSLSSEIALTLGYVLQSSLYKDESALSNYSLAQVFDLLERESMTGYVDIQFSGKRGFGTAFFLEGTSVVAVVMSSTGKIASGEQVFHKFLEIGEMIQPHVRVYRVVDPRPVDEELVFVMPWIHQEYLKFWHELITYFSSHVRDQFRRNRFTTEFRKVCNELSDTYPFLDPEEGDIKLSDEGLVVKTILQHTTFVNGMARALNGIIQHLSSRKFKRMDLELIRADVARLASAHEIGEERLNVDKLVSQIFRGIVT